MAERRHDPVAARASGGTIALLTSLVLLGQMSTSLYLPSLPSLPAALATDPASVQLTMTAFLAAFAVAQLVYGPVSDRLGRRPVLLAGIALYIFGSLACALAPTIGALIAGRLVQGMGACAGMTITRAVVRDRFEHAEATRALALIGVALTLGPALGPILGGQLEVWFGWRAGFVALVAFGLVVMVAVDRRLAESLRHPVATRSMSLFRTYGVLLASRAFWGHLLIVSGFFGALFAYATGVPFVLIELLGMSPDLFGFVFLLTALGYVAGSMIASRAAGRVPGERLVAIGVWLSLAGASLMLGLVAAGHLSPATVVGPMVVYFVGFGLALPSLLVGAMAAFPAIAGAASALIGFAQMTMAAAGSAGLAALYDRTALPMAGTILFMAALGALAHWRLIRRAGRAA
ncbi:MAG: multidrug effflux MFS transporter [Pseudomonadota bacterium]